VAAAERGAERKEDPGDGGVRLDPVLGSLAIVVGVGISVWGVRCATTRPRPISLAGSLAAAAGLALAFLGVFGILVPTLF
jgi:hypothetical protein